MIGTLLCLLFKLTLTTMIIKSMTGSYVTLLSPRIGTAVALRPGDFLLFNPQEPHSISSCCKSGDKIFCISSYLKMGVVGLNDNSNPIV